MAEARARYDARLDAIGAELKALCAGRKPRELTGPDAVAFMKVKGRFDMLAVEQKKFGEAVLASLLNPGDGGGETVET
jgi:hypothetical protein